MGLSLARQLLDAHRFASRNGRDDAIVGPGEMAIRVDHVLLDDATGPLAFLAFEATGRPRVQVDLALAGSTSSRAAGLALEEQAYLQAACRRFGAIFSRAGNGAPHQVHAARFAAPGRALAVPPGTPAVAGGLGMLVFPAEGVELGAALAGAPLIVPAPVVVGVELTGRPAPWVEGEDLVLTLARRLPDLVAERVWIEFHGPGVAALPAAARAAVARRAARLGVGAVLFPSDDVTRAALRAQSREADWKPFAAESGAAYDRALAIELGELEPMLDRPGDVVSSRVRDHAGTPVATVAVGPEVDAADLRRLARRLGGRVVHASVRLTVAVEHRQTLETLAREGALAALRAAGARVVERAAAATPGGAGARLVAGAAPETAHDAMVAGIDACAAAALAGALADPRGLPGADEDLAAADAAAVAIDDRSLVRPLPPGEGAESARTAALQPPPLGRPIEGALRGVVLLEASDHVGIDAILPWGARVRPHHRDVQGLARFAFRALDAALPDRAAALGGGFLVAGAQFGAGPSRPEAALVAVALGVRAVLARSYGDAWRRGLVTHGVLPLVFSSESDREDVAAGDELEIPDLPHGLEAGRPLVVRNLTRGSQLALDHDLNPREIATVRAGGLLRSLAGERREVAA